VVIQYRRFGTDIVPICRRGITKNL